MAGIRRKLSKSLINGSILMIYKNKGSVSSFSILTWLIVDAFGGRKVNLIYCTHSEVNTDKNDTQETLLPVKVAFFSVMFFLIGSIVTAKTWLSCEKRREKCPHCPTDLLLPSLSTLGVRESTCRRSQTPLFCEGEGWNGLYEFCMSNDCRFDLENHAELQNKINASISYQLTPKFSVECWTQHWSQSTWPCVSHSSFEVLKATLDSLNGQGRETNGGLKPSPNR